MPREKKPTLKCSHCGAVLVKVWFKEIHHAEWRISDDFTLDWIKTEHQFTEDGPFCLSCNEDVSAVLEEHNITF